MNALQIFMAVNHGFLTLPRLPELIALDRLCPVLVRCGCCRFTCAVQDVEHLHKCIEAGGDYIRDISFPQGSLERAAAWQDPIEGNLAGVIHRAENLKAAGLVKSTSQGDEEQRCRMLADDKREHPDREERRSGFPEFDESQCGGVYDGFGNVSSDADSGL